MILPLLKKTLQNLGLKAGETVYVASDISSFGFPSESREEIKKNGIDGLMASYVETLRSVVGEAGTIIMPTFSYTACKKEVFEVGKTPSTVGTLTEFFRKQRNTVRSPHPVFSMCAQGPRADELMRVIDHDCFGPDSSFVRFIKEGMTYLFLGIDMRKGATFVYSVEQEVGVYYRFFKTFPGKILNGECLDEFDVRYYVRDLDCNYVEDWGQLRQDGIESGIVKQESYYGAPLELLKCNLLSDLARVNLKKDKDYLISYP